MSLLFRPLFFLIRTGYDRLDYHCSFSWNPLLSSNPLLLSRDQNEIYSAPRATMSSTFSKILKYFTITSLLVSIVLYAIRASRCRLYILISKLFLSFWVSNLLSLLGYYHTSIMMLLKLYYLLVAIAIRYFYDSSY